jgi:TonB family protein
MIRPFLALSILVHGVAIAAIVAAESSRRVLPSAELRVALEQVQLNSSHAADRIVPVLTTRTPATPVSHAAVNALAGSGTTAEPAHADEPTERERRVTNHLRAALRAGVDAHFVYPPLARLHGWQGEVRLALTISADGDLRELRVLASSGYALLDQDAIQTILRLGKLPQARELLAGRNIHLELPVVYRLTEG